VPGTSVRMEPPPGFVPSQRFSGFEHAEAQASIQVNVVSGPLSEARKGMTKEGLQKRGMTLVASKTQTVNGMSALVLHVEQSAEGVAYEKWLVVAGDEKTTVLLVATTPKDADETFRAAMRATLLGATWDPRAPTDPWEGLPFRLTPAAPLTQVQRMGGNLSLTEPGRPKRATAGDPLYIVGVSVSPVDLTDLAAFAERRIAQTTGIRDAENLKARDVKVAGLDAREIVADARDTDSKAALLLYQVVVPDGKGYWIVQGIVAAEKSEEWLARFRQITASIRRPEADAPAPSATGGDAKGGPKSAPGGSK
jgi:hypothetical protein